MLAVVVVANTAVLLEMVDQVVVVLVGDHLQHMALMELIPLEVVVVEEDILPMEKVDLVVLESWLFVMKLDHQQGQQKQLVELSVFLVARQFILLLVLELLRQVQI
tara:strand:+ start:241 stop:558 length:318 start_codon:yes stop_codon:yes gene_type:complete